jgi:hypothetical protein
VWGEPITRSENTTNRPNAVSNWWARSLAAQLAHHTWNESMINSDINRNHWARVGADLTAWSGPSSGETVSALPPGVARASFLADQLVRGSRAFATFLLIRRGRRISTGPSSASSTAAASRSTPTTWSKRVVGRISPASTATSSKSATTRCCRDRGSCCAGPSHSAGATTICWSVPR